MTLPAYAEELKRLIDEPRSRNYPDVDIALHVKRHLDRILRDAEIAQVVREHVLARLPPAVRDILAKETP